MRITNNMLSQNLLRNLESAQGKMDNLQSELSSGLRITKPSDDPVGIQNALRMKSNFSAVEQWKNNADEALTFMNTTDSTLGDITTMLQRVRELTVQGANGTLVQGDRAGIALEVDQLSDQIRMLANTRIGTKYIFSGTQTDKEMQKWDGSTWQTQGNDQYLKFAVGNNLALPISVNGKTLFENSSSGGTGIFDTLSNLSTALKNDDVSSINDAIETIDGNIDNVIGLRADLGARTNRMTAIREQLDTTSYNIQKNISDIMDADMAKTITDFQNQQNVYKAALSVGAQIIQPSLVDFMR